MPTSGKKWREAREHGIEITLASGNVASLRPIEVDLFLRVGHIPDALAATVTNMINGKPYELTVPESEKLEQSKEWLAFLDELVRFAFVNPKVVDAPQADDEIAVDDISYTDKLFVYRFFSRPAVVLERFRATQAQSMASLVASADNGAAAQQNTEDKPMGKSNHRTARRVDGVAV